MWSTRALKGLLPVGACSSMLIVVACLATHPAAAQQEAQEKTPTAATEEPAGVQDATEEPPAAEEGAVAPCAVEPEDGDTWLEWTRDHVGLTVCRAALWFDGLFGAERVYEERDATFGWVKPSVTWNEIDGLDPDIELRVKLSLPRFDRRLSALAGRLDPDDVVEDSERAELSIPEAFRDTEDEWLLGLGYSPVRGDRRRFDLNAGLEVRTPPDVFFQARYRRQWFPTERSLIRWRETGFWHSEDGFGASTGLDVERLVARRFLVRWRARGTLAQHIDGVEWFGEMVLFHRLTRRQALAYRLSGSGESEAELPDDRYDLSVVYRRPMLRDWLFLELQPGATWRREEAGGERRLEPVLGIAVELQFGDWPHEVARP